MAQKPPGEKPGRNGEEERREELPQPKGHPTSPTQWKESEYHLRALESSTAPREDKFSAISGLEGGFLRRLDAPRDSAMLRVLTVYRKAENTELKAAYLHTLALLGMDIPEVNGEVLNTFKTPDTPSVLLSQGLIGLHISLIKGIPFTINPEMLGTLRGLVFHQDDEVIRTSLCVFNSLLGWVVKKPLIEPEELRGDGEFVSRLKSLQKHDRHSIRNLSEDLVIRLGLEAEVDDVERDRIDAWQRGDREAIIDRIEVASDEERRRNPSLDAQDMARLRQIVSKEAVPVVDFLGEYFRGGRQAMLLGVTSFTPTSFFDELVKLRQEVALTHVALPIPESDGNNINRFIDGEIPPIEWGYDIIGTKKKLGEYSPEVIIEDSEHLREVLQKLRDEGLRFIFYGEKPGEKEGGLVVDEGAGKISSVLSEVPGSRVIVLGHPFEMGGENLVDRYGKEKLGLSHTLDEKIGEEQLASVMVIGETELEDAYAFGIHNLAEFMDEAPPPRRFGVKPQNTPLAKLIYERDLKNTMGSTWDGLILWMDEDEGGDREKHPRPEEPEKTRPTTPIRTPVRVREEVTV